jgi:hypothetical protein
MSPYSAKPQRLIDQVEKTRGVSFIAHPYDPQLKALGEEDISWIDWDVRGFTGIELWNAMSEMKSIVHNRLDGLFYTLFPQAIARGPHPTVLKKWDELTQKGQKVIAIGGSDAHAFDMRLGPFQRRVFPYVFTFVRSTTHILTEAPLSGDLDSDRQMVVDASAAGTPSLGTISLALPVGSASVAREKMAALSWVMKCAWVMALPCRYAFQPKPNAGSSVTGRPSIPGITRKYAHTLHDTRRIPGRMLCRLRWPPPRMDF